MQLLVGQQKQTQFLGFVIVVGLLLIAPGHSQTHKEKADNTVSVVNGVQTKAEELTVKKALGEENSPVPTAEKQGQEAEKLVAIGDKSAADVSLAEKQKGEQKNDVAATPPPHQQQEATKKTGSTKSQTATDNKSSTVSQQADSAGATSSSSSYMYHHEETILNSDAEISDSLKAGFYFFVALSLSAISFIIFKVYRLRLSRAERKYGVQGDRSTQELTPLPISIEDGPSDDEDHTLFEVQRQNIRIL